MLTTQVSKLLKSYSSAFPLIIIEEQILEDIHSSDFFVLMTDEYIVILKELVLVARYMAKTGINTSFFLLIRDTVESHNKLQGTAKSVPYKRNL